MRYQRIVLRLADRAEQKPCALCGMQRNGNACAGTENLLLCATHAKFFNYAELTAVKGKVTAVAAAAAQIYIVTGAWGSQVAHSLTEEGEGGYVRELAYADMRRSGPFDGFKEELLLLREKSARQAYAAT